MPPFPPAQAGNDTRRLPFFLPQREGPHFFSTQRAPLPPVIFCPPTGQSNSPSHVSPSFFSPSEAHLPFLRSFRIHVADFLSSQRLFTLEKLIFLSKKGRILFLFVGSATDARTSFLPVSSLVKGNWYTLVPPQSVFLKTLLLPLVRKPFFF